MKKLSIALLIAMVSMSLFAQGVAEAKSEELAATNEIVIWSAASEEETAALVAKFNELHPEIKTTIITAGSNELKTRLMAEQPKPSGDILMGIAKETYDEFYDYFTPYRTPNHDSIAETVRDKGDTPRYYGYSMPLQCFIVNTKIFPEGTGPTSWKDLADPKYKGEIIMANPALSGSAYAQLYMMYSLFGEEFCKQVAKNTVYVASSKTVPESVARGEYGIGVTGEANVATYIEAGDPVTYRYPTEGTGARFDASAIIANCKNLKSAQLYMDFLTSYDAYKIINEVKNRRVVINELPGPKHLPALGEINLFDYNAVEAAELRNDLSDKFSNWIL